MRTRSLELSSDVFYREKMKKLASIVLSLGLCLGLSACVPGDLDSTAETEEITVTTTSQTTEATTTTTTEATTTTTTEETTTAAPPENLSPEWVRALPEAQDEANTQLIIVAASGMDETSATVSMHEKDENGRKGMVYDADRYEGCGRTPIGRYHFTKAFGIADDPGSIMPYTKITGDLYWSGDYSEHYNEMVSINDYPNLDKSNSEHLIDYTKPYQYCLNIGFNEDGTAGRGSAIFLHCFGSNTYTAGCVAIDESYMIEVLQTVRPECVIIIDLASTLGA